MKVYYTDEKKQKRLIGNCNSLSEGVELVIKDMDKKFVYTASDFKLKVGPKDSLLHFTNAENVDLGYTLETDDK